MPQISALVRCTKCFKELPVSEFYISALYKSGHHTQCRTCHGAYQRKWRKNPRNRIWQSSYINATNKGVVHSISPSDVPLPKTCVYLGIEINYEEASKKGGRTLDGPSIDRINPTEGYTAGNIQVISDLANRMKQNATPKQLIAFAVGTLKLHAPHLLAK